MEKSATINLRLTPQLKKDAEEVFDKLGLSMTNAIEIYLRQVVMRGGLPFDVVIPEEDAEQPDLKPIISKQIAERCSAVVGIVIDWTSINKYTQIKRTHSLRACFDYILNINARKRTKNARVRLVYSRHVFSL